MDKNRMYDLAFQLKKDKIWKKLYDTELFAVRLDDGQTGYCCVLGYNGEVLALTLYPDEASFQTFHNLLMDYDELMAIEDLPVQDCIQCCMEEKDELTPEELAEVRGYAKEKGIALRGANAYPQFVRYRPYCFPWRLKDEAEWRGIAHALEITHRLTEYLGSHRKEELGIHSILEDDSFIPLLTEDGDGLRAEHIPLPPKSLPVYPQPTPVDDMTAAKLGKLPKKGTLQCHIVRMQEPVQGDPDEAPYLPALFVMVQQESGMALSPVFSDGPKIDPDVFQKALVDAMLQDKACPAEIKVLNERTAALLKDLCEKLKIRLSRVEELPELEELLDKMVPPDEEDVDEANEQLDDIMDMLKNLSDEELRELPPFMKKQLLELAAYGVIPGELADRLK